MPDLLTWTALLAKWTDFARGAVALPTDGEGGRVRRAVPAIIALQSVTFALADLDAIPPDEQALGLDRAEILIERHDAEIGEIWHPEPVNPEVAEVLADARGALAAARTRARPKN